MQPEFILRFLLWVGVLLPSLFFSLRLILFNFYKKCIEMNTTILNTTSNEFKPLLDNFVDALLECKKMELGIGTIKAALKTLNMFHKELTKSSEEGRSILKDLYYNDLLRLKLLLKDPQLASFHDEIFINIIEIQKEFPRGLLVLFENLIKGITYFSYHVDISKFMPTYQKIYGCGVGDDPNCRSGHICSKDLPREEVIRRKDIIERCYIERKIYDELYKKAEDGQNSGHRHRLGLTREDFQSCFKDHDISVELKYEGSHPYEVKIKRTIKGKLLYEEVYTKAFEITSFGAKQYSEIVECTKYMRGKVFRKLQNFKTKGAFKEVKHTQP
jgi:hypothetical protein